MFQFGRFPSYTYWFSARSSCFTWWGFPIRIPADRGLFAAPRSFSQLIASFFGSWCQGIPLVLFLAWTSFLLYCMSFANRLFFAYCSILFPILLRTLLRKNHYILYSVFTKFFVILFFLLSYTALTVYRVLDLLSPILLSLSPRQFVCRYTLTIPY